jgi:peptidase MA superfamily protein
VSRVRPLAAVVVVGLAGVCVFLWQLRGEVDPPRPAAAPATGRPPEPRVAVAASVQPPPAPPELPPPPEPPELRGHDTVDPCSAGFEPAIPLGFETVGAGGVTVAWQPGIAARGPYDVAVQPTAIAHLVTGLLVEAAALTGTPRRERLAVVVYPSRAVFHAATHAPEWANGVYDGGAVRIAALPSAELGVEITSLRHEVLHAQLHTVGCMPAWLNEGLAMYFAGAPPIRSWMTMLRHPDPYDIASLEVPSFAALIDERAERAYAESLAMILFIVERSGDAGLGAAVQSVRLARPERGLWEVLYPGTGDRAVLDALARKLFGVPVGGELEAMFRGAVCCHGLRAVAELRCRGVPPRPDRVRWIDQSSSPRDACDATW